MTDTAPSPTSAASVVGDPWIARAQTLAEQLAPGAAQRDRAGGRPDEEVALLRESGLLEYLLPEAWGGAGGTYATSQRIVRIVARSDTSAAQILGYHYLLRHNALLRSEPGQREALARASAQGRWLWGGASNPRDPELLLTGNGEHGFRLSGAKNFASNAAVADRIVSLARLGEAQVLLAVPGDAPGVVHGADWDAFGQRRGVSASVRFGDVPIARDAILGPLPAPAGPAPLLRTLSVPLHQLYFVNLYLGTAEGALQQARAYVLNEARPWQTSGVERASDDPYVLELYGALSAELRASLALAEEAAAEWAAAWETGDALQPAARDAAAATIYTAKVHATKVSLEVTGRIFDLLGARATAQRYGFDRFWRNVRTHSLHDPLAYKQREVGNHALNGRITPDPLYT